MQSVQGVSDEVACLGFGRVVCEKEGGPGEMRARRSRDEVLCLTSNARQEKEWGLVGLDVRHGRRSETSGFQLKVCVVRHARGEKRATAATA